MASNNRFSLFGRRKEGTQISPKDQQELDNIKGEIDEIQQTTTFLIHGADQVFVDKNRDDLKQIRDTINSVSDKYKSVTGDSMIEFLTRMAMEDKKTKRTYSNNSNQDPTKAYKEKQQGLLDLTKKLENPNNGIINDLYAKEKSRISLMDEYDQIVNYIPQLNQALNVLVDNIISPDDFTKDIFSIFYNDKDINGEDSDSNSIINNLKEINEEYKFETKTRKLVTDTLKYGDQFVACLKYDTEFTKMFSEDIDYREILSEDKGQLLNEDSFLITEEEKDQLSKYLKEDNYEGNLVNDIIRMINENVTFTDNKFAIMEEDILLENEFKMETFFTDKRLKNTKAVDIEDPEPSIKKPTKKSIKTRGKNSKKSVMFNDNPLFQNIEEIDYTKQMQDELVDKKAKMSKENSKYYINGSYMRILDPRRIIKIYLNGHTYGYYYIETENNFTMNTLGQQNPLSKTSTFQLRNAVDIGVTNNSDKPKDVKTQLILDIFLKNISKKLNKKFILNNDEFKEMLYTLIKEDYITKKKVNIIYLSPDDVEHLYINLKEEKGKPGEGYGESVFAKVLFTAKLYLAILTCTLMMKVSRSADHRAFYIETGLSNDIEGTIQSFVREIKSKEIKISDMGSIDTVLNSVGMFHDYYIPQINGEKTIDIDTVPGQQADMDNDFLEFLRKAMISGMGIPASFLSYSDEMEFARSVSQMNSMFLRTIVAYQKYLGYGFSGIFRKLYRNEFGQEEELRKYNKKDDEKINVVDYDSIEIRFPSPATLNLTNLSEQLNVVREVSEFITTTLLGETGAMDPSKKDSLQKQVVKDLMQNVDWNKYEDILEHLPMEQIEDKLKNPNDDMTGMEGEPSMMGDDMMGDDPTQNPNQSGNPIDKMNSMDTSNPGGVPQLNTSGGKGMGSNNSSKPGQTSPTGLPKL